MPDGARFLFVAALGGLLLTGCGGSAPDKDPRVLSVGETVRVSLDDFGEKRGSFFTYTAPSGDKVDFLVYRETPGTYRAVLDACRKCYRWRKGYVIDGDFAVCRKCGERYELDTLREGRGSCVPIPLPSRREENSLVIPAPDLEAGARYF